MKSISLAGALGAALVLVPSATAAGPPITSVLGGSVPCLTAPSGALAGQRLCLGATAPYYMSTAPTFDGTPIDVSITLPPAPEDGPDGQFPVIGVFKGLGENKAVSTEGVVQRWVTQGFAVFSMTPRGFLGSCGPLTGPVGSKPPACTNGYSHLMSNAYEVRDVQHFLGVLSDEGVIDGTRMGSTGLSYGSGLSLQLGALKNRTQLASGALVPWTSPGGTRLSLAATLTEIGWSDLLAALQPNGSTLDYAEHNPYLGPDGDRRFGVQKQLWNEVLFGGAAVGGFYAAPGDDPTANVMAWKPFNDTGGPYDGEPLAEQQLTEHRFRGAISIDDSVEPAPALLMGGWNDDLFPVSEPVRYYNHVRAEHPRAAISMYHLNMGHPRGTGSQFTDVYGMVAAGNEWFGHYVMQDDLTDEPSRAGGQVTAVTTACRGTATKPGRVFHADSWAAISRGEIRLRDGDPQTVSPGTVPAEPFQSPTTTACTDSLSANTPGAAVYSTDPVGGRGVTVAGSPTVIADLDVEGPNDQLASRLYDVNPATGKQKLIARGVVRPTVDASREQVFQLSPQAWTVAPGHVIKLELLSSDVPFVRAATGQQPIVVRDLELRIPTRSTPGSADGLVRARAPFVLPHGYRLTRDAARERSSAG